MDGRFLRKFRNGLTQAQLGAILGVGQRFIAKIELGEKPLPEYMIPKLPLPARTYAAKRAIEAHQDAIRKLRQCLNEERPPHAIKTRRPQNPNHAAD